MLSLSLLIVSSALYGFIVHVLTFAAFRASQPFAFFARDYLRKLIVGKEVTFQSLYTVPNINREYGIILFTNGQNLAEVLVEDGVVRVRDDAGRREDESGDNALLEKLKIYEDQARTAGKGVWSTEEDGRVETRYENLSPSEAQAMVEANKGKLIDGKLDILTAVVDYVV